MRPLAFALVALLLWPSAAAQPHEHVDVRIGIPDASVVVTDASLGRVTLNDSVPGERYAFTLNLTANQTTFLITARGLAIERARQFVPHLELDAREPACAKPRACEFTIFQEIYNDRVWDVDSPARIANVSGTADDVTLRLGIPGPVNATLVLMRDITPPTFTLTAPTNFTTFGWYQESTTNELSIGDLQVREQGKTDWVQNPTPTFHIRQRFPLQGLTAEHTYESRAVFTDWAGNTATSQVFTVTMPRAPERPMPTVTPVFPAPNASLALGGVIVVRASIDAQSSPIREGGVRMFFDLKEVSPDVRVVGNEASYSPGALAKGMHRVTFEVSNVAGGMGTARWSFTVGEQTVALPMWSVVAALMFGAIVLGNWRHTRR